MEGRGSINVATVQFAKKLKAIYLDVMVSPYLSVLTFGLMVLLSTVTPRPFQLYKCGSA